MLQSQNGNAQSASVVSIKYTVAVKLGLTFSRYKQISFSHRVWYQLGIAWVWQ